LPAWVANQSDLAHSILFVRLFSLFIQTANPL